MMPPRHTETHPNARTNDAALERFEELRSGVGSHLSSSDMGALITRNPLQARNEITQVCKRVCEERPWLAPTNRERDILINRYLDSVFGLGPLEELLADERITEIMVNGSDALFYEADGVLYRSKNCFKNDSEVNALIDRIISPLGRRIDETSPMVNARLKQGHRVNAIIPPLSLDGPILTIRKFREQFFSLEDMRDLGSFDSCVGRSSAGAISQSQEERAAGRPRCSTRSLPAYRQQNASSPSKTQLNCASPRTPT